MLSSTFSKLSTLSYFQDLRSRDDITIQTSRDSLVMQLNASNPGRANGSDYNPMRLLHLGSFLPITLPGASGFENGRPIRIPFSEVSVNWEAAAFLAMIHFNQRNGSLIQELPRRLEGCDLHMTMKLYDTSFSPVSSVRQLYPLLFNSNHTLSDPATGGVIGALTSPATKSMATLTGIQGVPQISSMSSSIFESSNDLTLARTVPVQSSVAHATIELLKYWNVTHAGCLYTLSDYGLTFLERITREAKNDGIKLTVAGYAEYDAGGQPEHERIASASEAVIALQHLRYIVYVGSAAGIEDIFQPADELGMFSKDVSILSPSNRSNCQLTISFIHPL